MTWRKLGVLVKQLPPESALAREQRLLLRDLPPGELAEIPFVDPEDEQWSRTEQLLAGVRDELNTLRWLYTTAHFEKPDWFPEPLPRPGVGAASPVEVTEQGYTVLAAHLARTQGDDAATYT